MGSHRWIVSVVVAALVLRVYAQVPDEPIQNQPQPTYPVPDQPVEINPYPDQPYPDEPYPNQPNPSPEEPGPSYTGPDVPKSTHPLSDGSAAGCTCMGMDYTDGGAYLLDGKSSDLFVFNSVFNGMF
jgi:hypothetical protein